MVRFLYGIFVFCQGLQRKGKRSKLKSKFVGEGFIPPGSFAAAAALKHGRDVGAAYMRPASFLLSALCRKAAGGLDAAPTQMLAYYAIMVYRANRKRGY